MTELDKESLKVLSELTGFTEDELIKAFNEATRLAKEGKSQKEIFEAMKNNNDLLPPSSFTPPAKKTFH